MERDLKIQKLISGGFLITAVGRGVGFFFKKKRGGGTAFIRGLTVVEILKIFDKFSKIFGLKSNKSKCETAGIDVLKGVRVAPCGMLCINFNEQTVKILGIHFSYKKKLEEEKNFNILITKIKNVLNVWRIRDLKTEGKIVIYKSLAICCASDFDKTMPIFTAEQLNIIKKNFTWQGKKIKNKTLYPT